MRYGMICGILLVLHAGAARADYDEERELTLAARGVDTLRIDAGAGSMEIMGVDGATEITVTARIHVPGRSEDRALSRMADDMVLTLEQNGGVAMLKSYFDDGSWSFGDSPSIDLQVRVPASLHLDVEDGSGSLEVRGVSGDIRVDDGSGSMILIDVGGTVDIDDGSGTIVVQGAGGDVTVNDGSGSIEISDVRGSVTVDDGSGSIRVDNVDEDFIVVDDGSGSVDYSNVGGRVETDS